MSQAQTTPTQAPASSAPAATEATAPATTTTTTTEVKTVTQGATPAGKAGGASKPALTVTSVSPQKDSWDTTIQADGVVSPWQEAVIAAEIGGLRVTEVLVDVGETVKKGQPLAKLSQETVQADIAQQQAVINQAKAEVLKAQAGVSQSEAGVIQAQSGVTQAEAGLVQANANISQAQAALGQAEAGVSQASAGLVQANASYTEAKSNADRARQLKNSGALPMQQVDQYITGEATARAGIDSQKAVISSQKAAFDAQKAGVTAQKAGLAAKQAEVKSQEAAVESSRLAVKAQQAMLEAQNAALKVQQAALKSQEIRLNQTTIVAADDGVISLRTAALGSVVQTGAELFRIIRQNKLEWRAEVSSNDLGQIREGQTASVTINTGEVIEGQVRLISPQLDANTRRALVYVTLPAGSSARSGMFVQGTIRQGQTEALTIPQTTVILRDGRHIVFEIGADNHVIQHEVKLGRRVQDRVEIISDLPADLKLVATGGAFLNDGDLVQLAATGDKKP
ncbi:MAG TPA: efflux RND transporter periplasmic adaptor subunit [Thiolinea sp.]|nr:efflux RND transporter periplasmic adaptor subunit [Thiolinea sp.]